MRIHKEGYTTIIVVLFVLLLINAAIYFIIEKAFVFKYIFAGISFIFWIFIIAFFIVPNRKVQTNNHNILAPADGEIVVIEETIEEEYFKDRRIQISTFMSPMNIHVNWCPVKGTVQYTKYHKGKYLVAWHPKSSTLNERSTIVLKTKDGQEILVRQIAGAVARRIVTYPTKNEELNQAEQIGFIKFGSRVDIFLPLDADVKVELHQQVRGTQTVLANFA